MIGMNVRLLLESHLCLSFYSVDFLITSYSYSFSDYLYFVYYETVASI